MCCIACVRVYRHMRMYVCMRINIYIAHAPIVYELLSPTLRGVLSLQQYHHTDTTHLGVCAGAVGRRRIARLKPHPCVTRVELFKFLIFKQAP